MISALVLGVVLGLLGLLPLLGGPRYEAALIAGLLAPSWTGIQVALHCGRVFLSRSDGESRCNSFEMVHMVPIALRSAGNHALVVVLVASIHGILAGFCEPAPGYSLLLLGPCLGLVLMSQCALVASWIFLPLLQGRCSRRLLLFVLGAAPVGIALGSALIRGWQFYSTPTVFAFDPFVGYFSGPLYDTVEYDLDRVLSFRVGTCLTLGALILLLSRASLERTKSGTSSSLMKFARGKAERWNVGFFGLLVTLSVLHTSASDLLGHTQTAESIQSTLGRKVTVASCGVYFSSGVETKVAERMAQECAGHVSSLGNYFGHQGPPTVHVYLFESSSSKRYLMGAGHTYIAKPWRREIYLQPAPFPHPVLRHELAHVLAGTFGQGPFQVSGLLNAIIPDPGRIEGFAVAAAPPEDSEGTLDEWTAAMKQIGLLPPLQRLFRLSFFGSSAARSYAAAGSFVDFIHQEYGSRTLRRWYGGDDLPLLTGKTWGDLEVTWHRHLEAVEVPTAVLELSKPRFSRPGVFERRCPHAVDRAVDGASRSCGTRAHLAEMYIRRAVELDPLKSDLELMLPECTYAAGDTHGSLVLLRQGIENESRYSSQARKGALDFEGNVNFQLGNLMEARNSYEAALSLTFGRDERRQLEVKLWSLGQPREIREVVRGLLAPSADEPMDASVALGRWFSLTPQRSMPAYLLLKQALRQGHLSEARHFSDEIQIAELPLPSVRREALRDRVLLACQELMEGSPERISRALMEYRADGLTRAEAFEAGRLEQRCDLAHLRVDESSTNLRP